MTDVGPGEYWGSDHLPQRRSSTSEATTSGGSPRRYRLWSRCDELAGVRGRRGLSADVVAKLPFVFGSG